MRAKFKPWAVPYMEEHPEYVIEQIDFENRFTKPTYLEIGSGKGDFIIDMATRNPNYDFFAVEVNTSVSGIACKKMVEKQVQNVKLVVSDISDQFCLMPDEIFDGLFLNFSDPWPKKRHEKRRLTYPTRIDEYYRLLKKGTKLYFKTDNYDFYLYSKAMFLKSKFKMIFDTEDYIFDDTFDSQSEYEKLFRSRGLKINRIILVKE